MRTAAICVSLVLTLAAGCERENFAPLASGEPEPEPKPELGPPPCSGFAVEDACLLRSSFQLPGPYRFLGRADADADGQDELVAFSYGFQTTGILFFTLPSEQQAPKLYPYFVFPDHDIYRPLLLDFDGDGRTDFAGATDFWYYIEDHQTGALRVFVWRNRGEFQFEENGYLHSEFPPTLAAGDVDGDGLTDLFSVSFYGGGSVSAYDPQTDTIVTASQPDLEALQLTGEPRLAAADHDGDVHADFVLMDGSGRAWWLVGGPGHQLTVLDPQAPVVLTPESQSFYARDLDGDGLVDLIAARLTYPNGEPLHTISLALGQPGGGFAALTSFDAAHEVTSAGIDWNFSIPRFTHMGFLDLDGSGKLALVYAHNGRPELVIHPRITETLGSVPVIVPLDFPAVSLFVDDFEADGDGEDAVYVMTSHIVAVEPGKENPDGFSYTHHVVRHAPDR